MVRGIQLYNRTMSEILEDNSLNDTINVIYDNYSIFLVCVSGLLAIATPLAEPMWFMPNERKRYVRTFRNEGIIIGPSAFVFMILVLFWNIVLPLLSIPNYQAIPIIGSVYVYILMIYGLMDEPCTPPITFFLITNIITTMIIYPLTYEHYIIAEFLLVMLGVMCWKLHLSKHSLKQNIQWYIWYAGTFGGTLRW